MLFIFFWIIVGDYNSVFPLFSACSGPMLAAHLKPKLSEAESGVFPILQSKGRRCYMVFSYEAEATQCSRRVSKHHAVNT